MGLIKTALLKLFSVNDTLVQDTSAEALEQKKAIVEFDDFNADDVTVDASGFSGNLDANDTDVQKVADAVDGLSTGGGGGDTANVSFITPTSVGSVENSTTETDVLNWTIPANSLADGEMLEITIGVDFDNTGGNTTFEIKGYAGSTSVVLTNNITTPTIYNKFRMLFKFFAIRNGTSLDIISKSLNDDQVYASLFYLYLGQSGRYGISTLAGLDFTAAIAMKLTATLGTAAAGTGIGIKSAEIKQIKVV